MNYTKSLRIFIYNFCEKIIRSQLLLFLLEHEVIPPNQHGFVLELSVITNLLQCVDNWSRSVDRGESIGLIYLDFAKAFDKVPLRRLLAKLGHFEVRGLKLS